VKDPKAPLYTIPEAAKELEVPVGVVRDAVTELDLGRDVGGRVALDDDDLDAVEDFAEEIEAEADESEDAEGRD